MIETSYEQINSYKLCGKVIEYTNKEKTNFGHFLGFPADAQVAPSCRSFEINGHGASVSYHYDVKHLE